MTKRSKLELVWPGKDERPRLEPRILIEEPDKGHRAAASPDGALFDNMLIKGDNLLAVKAVEAENAGKVKCIFIDPPYNTGSAFEHYDDGLEHSLWLSLVRDRIEIIRNLLSADGSLWVILDDNEAHYFRVLCDEVFGRRNFIANVVWQKAYTSNQTAKHISNTHDHLLIYAKNEALFSMGKVSRTSTQEESFKNPDNDLRGPWKAENLSAGKFYSAGQFTIVGPTGISFRPPVNRYWRCNEEQYQAWLADGRITFGKAGTGRPMLKKFLREMQAGLTPNTWWTHEEVGSNKEASLDLKALFPGEEVFGTPKPEKLLRRVLELSTNPGDLVLDSFAGSGTTGAVAHKMGRRWIMVEIGDHADTHIVPRLTKIIDGEDAGGVTKAVGWAGGGGFRYFRLAPSLLKEDRWGNWVIAGDYDGPMLAQAMCKHLGFTYAPSEEHWWLHGRSSERDFLYVTTQSLTADACRRLSDEVGPERSLLVACKAYEGRADGFDNLTLEKIPSVILKRCEWGRDDYSLKGRVADVMDAEPAQ